MNLGEFLSAEAGQRRRAWLDAQAQKPFDMLRGVLGGTGIPERVEAAVTLGDMLNPVSDIGRAGQSSRVVFDPDATGRERFDAGVSMATDMAAVLAPAAAAKVVGGDGARAVAEALANVTMPADDAVQRFALADDGAIRAWHGTKRDFDRFSIDETPNEYLWFSNDKGYAEGLAGRTNLSKRNAGSVFEVDLDVRNPLEIDITEEARRVAEDIGLDPSQMAPEELEDLLRGGSNYESLVDLYKPQMESGGHDAIAFRNTFDGYGRETDQFVIFDENLIEIVKKYGIAGAAAMLGMSQADLEAQLNG